MDSSIPLVVAIIGAFGSIITIFINKFNDTKAQSRKIKEK